MSLHGRSLRSFRRGIGMIFQSFNLITRTTVIKNVLTAFVPDLPWWRATFGIFTKDENCLLYTSQEQMTEYLLDRKQYKSLGYIGGIYEGQNWRIGVNRLEGLKGILSARNAYDERFFHIGEISRESGYALAKHAVETGALPEAVLLGSDEVAEGALEADVYKRQHMSFMYSVRW